MAFRKRHSGGTNIALTPREHALLLVFIWRIYRSTLPTFLEQKAPGGRRISHSTHNFAESHRPQSPHHHAPCQSTAPSRSVRHYGRDILSDQGQRSAERTRPQSPPLPPQANSLAQTLIVPAVISLLLFLVSTFVLLPLWQRYRNRYSQYLPLETISNQTLSLRGRMQGAMVRFMSPSTWRVRAADRVVVAGRASFDSEDGEELDEVDDIVARAVVDQARGNNADSTRRLSRE